MHFVIVIYKSAFRMTVIVSFLAVCLAQEIKTELEAHLSTNLELMSEHL